MAQTTSRKSVLLIGLDPKVVDYTLFSGLDERQLRAGLQAALDDTIAAGFAAEWCLIDRSWERAEPVLRATLAATHFAAILIGAGIRSIPAHFLLFEQTLNLIHTAAPGARLCFNNSPNSTTEALLRWVRP